MFQDLFIAVLFQLTRLLRADLIQCFTKLLRDVKSVQDIQRLPFAMLQHLQVCRPHVRASELDASDRGLVQNVKEPVQAGFRAILRDV